MPTGSLRSLRTVLEMIKFEHTLFALPFALAMNNLKMLSSRKVVSIVGQAMLICGLEGYRNDSAFSIDDERLVLHPQQAPGVYSGDFSIDLEYH